MAEQSTHPGQSLEFLGSFFGGGTEAEKVTKITWAMRAESASTRAIRRLGMAADVFATDCFDGRIG